jgi:hypothetical protein
VSPLSTVGVLPDLDHHLAQVLALQQVHREVCSTQGGGDFKQYTSSAGGVPYRRYRVQVLHMGLQISRRTTRGAQVGVPRRRCHTQPRGRHQYCTAAV